MDKKIKCSHCNKELSDFYIELSLSTQAVRLRTDDTKEVINNSIVSNIEYLCKDCFDEFATLLENF